MTEPQKASYEEELKREDAEGEAGLCEEEAKAAALDPFHFTSAPDSPQVSPPEGPSTPIALQDENAEPCCGSFAAEKIDGEVK